jgi:hypothetical protein
MLEVVGRFLLALWHVVGLLLVAALLVEFAPNAWRRASRWLRYRRGDRPDSAALADANADADWAVSYFDEFRRAVRVDWRAYVEWWQRPFRGRYVTLDARGLRPTPGEDAADPAARRILCFGGSTMMGMGVRDAATIPAILARRLGELGHAAAVTNYGQLGHNFTQESITLQQLLKFGARCDIAVFYDGINEMACAEQTGRADGLFNEARRRAEFNLLHDERRGGLAAAALLSMLPRTMRRLRRLTGLELRGPLPALEADLSQIDLAALANEVIETYWANVRLIRVLAAEYGFRPLFFWQPVITSKRVKSRDELRFEGDYTHQPEARRVLYAAIVAARRTHPGLAQSADAIDLSALFDEVAAPIYIDLYHLAEAGNAAAAEAMVPAVAALCGAIAKSG